MESLEEIIEKVPPPPRSMEQMRFSPGDKVYSRNPKNDVIEEGWEVVGVDEKKDIVLLQKDGATREQSQKALRDVNMLFLEGSLGAPSQAQNPENEEELEALSKKVEELLQ